MPAPLPTQAELDKATALKDTKLQQRLRDRKPKIAVEGSVEVYSNTEDPLMIQTDPTGGHPLAIDQPVQVILSR